MVISPGTYIEECPTCCEPDIVLNDCCSEVRGGFMEDILYFTIIGSDGCECFVDVSGTLPRIYEPDPPFNRTNEWNIGEAGGGYTGTACIGGITSFTFFCELDDYDGNNTRIGQFTCGVDTLAFNISATSYSCDPVEFIFDIDLVDGGSEECCTGHLQIILTA